MMKLIGEKYIPVWIMSVMFMLGLGYGGYWILWYQLEMRKTRKYQRGGLKKGLLSEIENEYVRKLAENINAVKKQLGMSITPINDAEDVSINSAALYELISTLKAFDLGSLQTREWFDKYDEATDNALTEVLELHKNDLVDIHQTIETIVESLNEDDDNDGEDMDMDLEMDV